MEIVDMLKGFNLDRLSDKDIQAVARGIVHTMILKDMDILIPEGRPVSKDLLQALRHAIEKNVSHYLHKAIGGNFLDKAAMVATVTKNVGKASSFAPVELVEVNADEMISAVSDMHYHSMSEDNYKTISSVFANLFISGSLLEKLASEGGSMTSELRDEIRSEILNKGFSFLKMAMASKDSLVDLAQQSKDQAQEKQ